MEIKSLKNTDINHLESKSKQAHSNYEKIDKKDIPVEQKVTQLSDWQESVLQIAQNYLENKSQVVNSHPLSHPEYQQIETLEEALAELEQTRLGKFKEDAVSAQANLSPEQILYLFTQ